MWTGVNCDSEAAPTLEAMAAGTPKVSCDLRQAGSGMFPASFNKLREVLYNEHADLWEVVGGMMIYNHDYFIYSMNETLDTVCDARMTMSACCDIWLEKLKSRPKTYRS